MLFWLLQSEPGFNFYCHSALVTIEPFHLTSQEFFSCQYWIGEEIKLSDIYILGSRLEQRVIFFKFFSFFLICYNKKYKM